MSFRNYNYQSDSKANDKSHSNNPPQNIQLNQNSPSRQVLKKIADIIVNLHQKELSKCQNIQVYRDLSSEEQNLLQTVNKDTSIHTVLAGILAIDSCVKCIQREEQLIIFNILRAITTLIGQFKALSKQIALCKDSSPLNYERIDDIIKYVLQQIQYLPASRGKSTDIEKQINLLVNEQMGQKQIESYKMERQKWLNQLHNQNQLLKMDLREKVNYIKQLQDSLHRKDSKNEKNAEKRTSHSIGLHFPTQKSSENDSNTNSIQQGFQQIIRLKEELLEKNNIVIKMNEQYASQMQKYNSVFKRLEEENKMLKRYNDIDTACMLDELEYEVEVLREEKLKDQFIIAQIQRKIEGISMVRTSRAITRPYEFADRIEQYNTGFMERPVYQYRINPPNRIGKYYSPVYTSRNSPFLKQSYLKEEINEQPRFNHEQVYRGNYGKGRRGLHENIRQKSRNKLENLKLSRQFKQSKPINLYERVISKRR